MYSPIIPRDNRIKLEETNNIIFVTVKPFGISSNALLEIKLVIDNNLIVKINSANKIEKKDKNEPSIRINFKGTNERV